MAEGPSHAELFRWFVLQQQQMVMLNLGKLVNPVTGKVERDLDAARLFIDLLGMFEAKTRGNLDADEERFLGQVLTNLRLNFVEEVGRKPADEEAGSETTADGPVGDSEWETTADEPVGDSEGETTADDRAGDGEDTGMNAPPSRPAEA